MSQKLQVGLQTSIVGLIMFGIIVGSYMITENQKVTKQNEASIINQDKNIQYINKTLNNFIDKWSDRIKVSNEVNNDTQRQLLSLAHNQSIVIKELGQTEKDILGNLTDHRVVSNDTRDTLIEFIKGFNQTNESGRSDAVDQIIEAVNNHTEFLLSQKEESD